MESIFTNAWLSREASGLKDYLEVVCVFRLFQNDIGLSPASTLAAFVECDFGGYIEIPCDGNVQAPQFVEVGRYRLPVGPFTYSPPGVLTQSIWGWYIVDTDSDILVSAQHWNTPIVFGPTSQTLRLTANLDTVSGSIM